MSVEELIGNFDKWNPMENDYKNIKFNQYVSGPGAELDSELQPGQQALRNSKNTNNVDNKEEQPAVPCLIFRNLPKDMTIKAMHNLCSRHGRVTAVRDSTKNGFYFVDLASVADMEAVFRALEHNTYGFNVVVSKNNKKKSSDVKINKNNQCFSPVPPSSTGIDYENRRYRTSSKNHPRPKVKDDSLLNIGDAVISLPLTLLKDDAHSLERQGLYKLPNNNKFNYRNGRSYVNMPETTKQFINKKNKESSGVYNISENKYIHTSENSPIPTNISKCSYCNNYCDTVCERCSLKYYCGLECQLSDWMEHRYICGKPNYLQKTPSKTQPQSDNEFPKMSKEYKIKSTDSNSFKDRIQNGKMDIETNSSKQLPISSKILPKQLQNSQQSVLFSQHQNFAKATPKQIQNLSKSFSQQISSPPKVSSQPLSATLKLALQEHPSTSKAIVQHLSNSLKTSQNNNQKSSEDYNKIYKQNMPLSGNIVTITSISKTNVVFVRCKTYDADLSFFNTIDSLQAIGTTLKPLKTLPESGEVVVAKFEEQFNRALVLNVNEPTKVLIHFMDYGNIELYNLEDLYEIPKEFLYKPHHAIQVQLKNVSDFYMTQEIRKFMHSYLNNINVEIRYKPEDFNQENCLFAVELIDENTQQNFNKMIIKLSKPVEPQNSNEICERGYLDQKVLPAGKNVEYIVMDNSLMCSGCISCTIKPYAIEIDKFKKEIQAYVKSIPKEAYTPRVQELCIARYSVDGLWYRGLCLETVGDGHPSIHFIDYGNITIVPIEDIRRYPRQFTYPIYSVDCAIEGLPELCHEKLVTKLEELIPNGEIIKCDNVTVEEDNHFYFLSLSYVIKELTKCGLIKNRDK